MNDNGITRRQKTELHQVEQFRGLVMQLFRCCQDRMQLQCEKFGLPDAEIRCLLLFGEDKYLTPKGISQKLDVVKSRVTKIVDGLIQKKIIQKVSDPRDARIVLLSLTPVGQKKLDGINTFMRNFHSQVLGRIHPDRREEFLDSLELLRMSMAAVSCRMVEDRGGTE